MTAGGGMQPRSPQPTSSDMNRMMLGRDPCSLVRTGSFEPKNRIITRAVRFDVEVQQLRPVSGQPVGPSRRAPRSTPLL